MSVPRVLVLVGSLFALTHLAVHAQDTPASEPSASDTTTAMRVEMEPLEVTAAPFQITGEAASFAVTARTRTAEDLNTTPSLTLERITDGIPGLFVGSREHYALGDRLTIRGLGWRAQFGVRGVQVLLDGIPLTVADGQAMIGIVDPSFIRNIEVIRGPASTFWGNASGGVIAMSTRPASGETNTARAKVVTGSYGLWKFDAQATPDVGRHRLNLYGSYLTQDGYRAHSETDLIRSGLTSDIRLGDDNGFRTVATLQHMPQAQNPSTLTAEDAAANPTSVRDAVFQFDTGKTVTQGQVGTTYYDRIGDSRLNLTGYGIIRDLENPIPFGYIDLYRRVAGVRSTLEGTEPIADGLSWGIGAEGKLQRDDRREFGNDGGEPSGLDIDQLESVDNVGVFSRSSLALGRIRVSAGLRYDRMTFEADDRLQDNDGTRTFDTWSPSVGIAVDVSTSRFFANLSKGLEAPTANELGNRPDGQTGFNPNLDPEDIWGLEVGMQGVVASQRLSYDVAVFGTRVNDLLVPQQRPDEQVFFRNAGQTEHLGFESALRWSVTDHFYLSGSYTFVDATFTDAQTADGTSLNGNRIPGVPPHTYSASAEWRTDVVWMTGRINGLGSHEVNSANTAENDGYTRIDLEVSRPFTFEGTSIAPFVAVNNVFDTQYSDTVINAFGGRYYEPAAGRHYRFGVTFQAQ